MKCININQRGKSGENKTGLNYKTVVQRCNTIKSVWIIDQREVKQLNKRH